MTSPAQEQQPAQAVRFSDVNEEIEPTAALPHVASPPIDNDHTLDQLDPQAERELRDLSKSIQNSRCQAKRMEKFSFEPVSLPASRVGIT